MIAVGLGPEAARPYVDAVANGKVVIACINSPSSVTLSGDEIGIDDILATLQSQNIFARKLRVVNAYHSHHMQVLADDYLREMDQMMPHISTAKSTVKMASSVTGKCISHTELGPPYWVQNLISPVRFSEAVETLLKQPVKGRRQARSTEAAFDCLLEIGPHAALKGPLREILQAHSAGQIPYDSILVRGERGTEAALAAAGTLFRRGVAVNIAATNNFPKYISPLTDLPSYPWNHSLKYWADSRISRARQFRKAGRHDLLGAPAQESDDLEPRWRHFLRVSENPWIRDHVVHSSILYPGSGILAMPLHALQTLAEPGKQVKSIELRDVHITKAIVVPDDASGLELFLRLRRQRPLKSKWNGWWEFSVCSNQENDRVEEHGFGLGKIHYQSTDTFTAVSENDIVANQFQRALMTAQAANPTTIQPDAFYNAAKIVGLTYGPSFQGLTEITATDSCCTWKLSVPDTRKLMPSEVESAHIVHPTTLDIVFHSLFAALGDGKLDMKHAAVPIGLRSLNVSMDVPSGGGAQLKGISKVSKDLDRDILADIYVADAGSDAPSIIVQGLRCRELSSGNSELTSALSIKAPVGHVVQKTDIDLLSTRGLANYISREALAKAHSSDEEIFNPVDDLDSAIVTTIDLLAHKNPTASILQVGGVTATLTEKILAILGSAVDPQRQSCDIKFCDSNHILISELATKYQGSGPLMQFSHIQPEGISIPVEAKDNSFDLVLLGSDTHSLEIGNQAIRVLKPGGKFLRIGLGEHDGVETNGLDPQTQLHLEVLLRGTRGGFSQQQVLYFATKPSSNDESVSNDIVILLPPNASENIKAIAEVLQSSGDSESISIQIVHWPAIPVQERPLTVVSLLEYSDTFLTNISPDDYSLLKMMAVNVKRLLWVARGSDPALQTAMGFLRTLNNENVGLKTCFVLLENNSERDVLAEVKVVQQLLCIQSMEMEYIENNGDLYCSRWDEKHELSALVGATTKEVQTAPVLLLEQEVSLILSQEDSRRASRPIFVPDEAVSLPLSAEEVDIQLQCLILRPQVHDSAKTGWREAVGLVTSAGSDSPIPVGSSVSFAYNGQISTSVRVQARSCEVVPEDQPLQEAALRSLTYPSIYHSLFGIAQLDSTKTVLIQGGRSLLGQVAVALAKETGSTIFASATSEEDSLFLQASGIPPDHVLNDKELCENANLRDTAEVNSFDVIINTTGDEETVSRLWLSVASNGHLVDVSSNGESGSSTLAIQPFRRGASFDIVDMGAIPSRSFDDYQAIRDSTIAGLSQRADHFPMSLPTFAVDQLQKAVDVANEPAGIGAAVIIFKEESKVEVPYITKNRLRLRGDATYVLAGGLGGLGRSIAKLMVDSGAKHLVFLSRSGPASAAARHISEEFGIQGVTIDCYACDIAGYESVASVFETIAKSDRCPPIRGIVQSAAVLRDSIFENMTYDQWIEAIRPKVQGSWNLHQASLSAPCAEEGLDFFLMLSSISGFTGNRGQANYAAGNTYQDALARYRRSQGLAATSVNLGLMQDIGLIAERGGHSNLSDDSVVPLTAHDFELIIKMVLNSEGHDVPAQIVTGLPTGGILQRKGIELLPFYYSDRRFSRMKVAGIDGSIGPTTSPNDESDTVEEQLAAAASREQANETVLQILLAQVAKALRCAAEDVDASKPMHSYGLDSLMAVDMRGWILSKLKAEISLFDVMGGGSISMIAEKISRASKLVRSDLD